MVNAFSQGTLHPYALKLNHDIEVADIEILMKNDFLIEKELKYTKTKGRIYKLIEYFSNLAKMRFNSFNLFIKAFIIKLILSDCMRCGRPLDS